MKKIIFLLLIVPVLVGILFNENCMCQWQSDVRLSNNSAYNGTSWNNAWSIASNGNSVHVVYTDDGAGNLEIFYRRSTNSGLNWEAETRLTNSADSSVLPSIALSGTTLHLVWQDKRDGNTEIYYKRSSNNGLNWETDFRFTNTSINSNNPCISVSGSYINVVWQEGGGIYYRRSTNGGVNWGADVIIRGTSNSAHTPSICMSGSNVYIAWMELISQNNYVVYCKRSSDYGVNWGPNTTINNINLSSQWNPPSIAVSGSHIYVVYNIYNLGNWGIYYKHSTDGGTSWEPEYPIANSSAVFPNIAVSGSAVHIAYMGGFQLRKYITNDQLM